MSEGLDCGRKRVRDTLSTNRRPSVGENSMTQSVLFEGMAGKPVIATFDQPNSSSDAGALLLQGVDERLGLTRALAGCLRDAREVGKVQHSLGDLVRQRVFMIACG